MFITTRHAVFKTTARKVPVHVYTLLALSVIFLLFNTDVNLVLSDLSILRQYIVIENIEIASRDQFYSKHLYFFRTET